MKEKNLYNVQPSYAKQYILEYFSKHTFETVCVFHPWNRFKAANEIRSWAFWVN